MTVYNEVFTYVNSLFGVKTKPQLDVGDSFAAQIAPSHIDRTFFDGQQDQTLCILLLGKSKDQFKLSEKMFEIAAKLNKMRTFEHGIYAIKCSIPSPVGIEDRQHIYSCVIDVKFIC